MRTVARTMLWTLLVALCLMARPAVGQQSGAARSAGDSGVQVDKNSVGGVVLNSNGAKPPYGGFGTFWNFVGQLQLLVKPSQAVVGVRLAIGP